MDWTKFGQGIMSDPFVNLGLGILAGGQGAYGSFGQQLGQGAMAGIVSANRAQEWAQRRQMQEQARQLQLLREQQQLRQQALIKQAVSGLPADKQAMALAFPQQWAKSQFDSGTGTWQNYQKAQQQGFPGSFMDYQRALANAGATTIKMPSVSETTAAGKLLRIQQASDEITKLADAGGDVMGGWDYAVTTYAPDILKGVLRTDAGNRLAAAQNQWIQTFGRSESGAAIPQSEWVGWRADYFPLPGDDAYTIRQKQRARQAVEAGMGLEAGRARYLAESGRDSIKTPDMASSGRSLAEKMGDSMGVTEVNASDWKTLPDGTRYRVKP